MTPPDITTLFDIAGRSDDPEAVNAALLQLADHVEEWPALRARTFALLARSGTKTSRKTAFIVAWRCAVDALLAEHPDDRAILDAACVMVLILTAGGEDWFGEPEMEGWIDASHNLDCLPGGARALPRLIASLGRHGGTADHALALACIRTWADLWIAFETDPHGAEERAEMAARGWTPEHLRAVASAAAEALGASGFDAIVETAVARNDRDAVAALYAREGVAFDWFAWKAMQRLRRAVAALFAGEIVAFADDDDPRWILRFTESGDLLTALWCAAPETRERVINLMARKVAAMVEDDIADLSPPTEARFDAALDGLARAVEGLLVDGRLSLRPGVATVREAMADARSA